jgi:stage III sporulation protein SpoIIIAA
MREVSRLLAERSNLCIVDTKGGEIAGFGDIPHPCVGHARRFMVPSPVEQTFVMNECVVNHSPDVLVIDEVSCEAEVQNAMACKQRGVRLISSADGDLRKLLRNPKLCGLVDSVNHSRLTRGVDCSQQASQPVFDIIVDFFQGNFNEWGVVLDTADAVERIFDGRQYRLQRRLFDPKTGIVRFKLERA